jgi:hypothetical protein
MINGFLLCYVNAIGEPGVVENEMDVSTRAGGREIENSKKEARVARVVDPRGPVRCIPLSRQRAKWLTSPSSAQFLQWFANRSPCLIGMKHTWSLHREFQ